MRWVLIQKGVFSVVAIMLPRAREASAGVSNDGHRLRSEFATRAVTRDQLATCQRILSREGSGRLLLMPTHHVNAEGDLSGFCYRCNAHASGGSLPISRRMFFGHTAVECLEGEAGILRLMADEEGNRDVMRNFLHAARGPPALLDCIPDNSDALTSGACGLLQGGGLRTIDCKEWSPELPHTIGIYHAYLRGYTREVRTHKMFIVCSGGLDKASDEFCNMLLDVGDKWTAGEVAVSEEAWWLRRACSRARCKLLKELADAFSLKVSHVQDIHSHVPTSVVVPTIDTVEHDIVLTNGTVSLFNECVDTTRPFNGLLTRMHAGEGYWLFRGAPGAAMFGSAFGDSRRCGAFPTSQPELPHLDERNGRLTCASGIICDDCACVVRKHESPGPVLCQPFDEAYLKVLERMDWNRDNGCVELMPIVVGTT